MKYIRAWYPGGTYFFTVNLAERSYYLKAILILVIHPNVGLRAAQPNLPCSVSTKNASEISARSLVIKPSDKMMQEEFLILAISPILGLIVLADAFLNFSAKVTKKLGFENRADSSLLIILSIILTLLVLLLIVTWQDIPVFAIQNFGDAERELAKTDLIWRLIIIEFILISISSGIVIGLALKFKKVVWTLLLIAILGNFGAVIWTMRNIR